ncbi:ABC transporter ATP-binding protein [Compostibacter hankyongensis]|uniref:ABC transporter ATP-binding protein n=1 Tax=Compostibacter hankyongensis TaxID=1007089 RepID=A0ABP8G990_9BACT
MITVSQLSFTYRKGRSVLEDLSLQLEAGHICGLLGRNGTGKSTLLYQLCGLLFPVKGSCEVLGFRPGRREPEFLQQVFLLPEAFYMPDVTVESYLGTYTPFYPAFDREAFYQYLNTFEVPRDAQLRRISHGQQKKVLISFALATKARILLMDEPTNGLDIPSKRQFRKLMAGNLLPGQLILISTHQVKDLDSLIDEVLILDDHRIILHESVDRITEKLAFHQVMEPSEVPGLLFSEGALKGYAVVAQNTDGEHTKMDMEMFFNAVLAEKPQVLPLFNR